jgi:hypothetical protein
MLEQNTSELIISLFDPKIVYHLFKLKIKTSTLEITLKTNKNMEKENYKTNL